MRTRIIQLVSPGFLAIDELIKLTRDNYANGKQLPRRRAFRRLHERVGPTRTTIDRKAARCFTAVLTIGEFGGEEEAVTRLPQSDVTIQLQPNPLGVRWRGPSRYLGIAQILL